METKENVKKKFLQLKPHFCITGAIMGLVVLMSLIIVVGQHIQFSNDFSKNVYKTSILVTPDRSLYTFIIVAHVLLLLFSIYRTIFGHSAKESTNKNLLILNIALTLSLFCITFMVPVYYRCYIPKGSDPSQMSSIMNDAMDVYGISLK